MFDFVRKHNRLMQLLLFLLIFPSFVLFGLEGYNRMQEKGDAVARVDGRDITQAEWEAEHKGQMDRLRQAMPNVDVKMLDSPEARYGTLERMVEQRVLDAAARSAHLTASDQRVARELQADASMARLRGPDGKLDMAMYRQLLAAQGMTPEMFENRVREQLSTRQVSAGVNQAGFSVPAIANVALGAYFERREVQVAMFPAADFAARVNPTDAELEAFYKAHPQLFQAPEQASIEYVMLDLESVAKGTSVNEQELKAYYENNAGRIAGNEERRASHILVAAAKDAPADKRAQAKAKAEQLLAAVKKAPETFADVARKQSDHKETAAKGGDLDFFTRNAMPPAFGDLAFSMKKGEIGGVVESELGYHLIKLTDIKGGQRSYEDVRPALEAELKKQQAQRKYAEAAEIFNNSVYEQADSLKPVAEKLKLQVHTVAAVTRQPKPGATGPLANPKFLAALFSPDAVEKKRNTEAMEIAPNQMVSGRIVQHSPARTRPLEEVKAQVREALVAQRATELAKKEGQDKLAAWKATPASAVLPAPVTLSREETQKQPRQIVEAALRAELGSAPVFAGVDLGNQGYAVVKVSKTLPRPEAGAEQAKAELTQFSRWETSAQSLAYYELLKERFKVQIKAPKPQEGQ